MARGANHGIRGNFRPHSLTSGDGEGLGIEFNDQGPMI